MQCRVDTFRRGSRARGWRGRTIASRDHSNERTHREHRRPPPRHPHRPDRDRGTALIAANNGLAANGFPVGVGYVGVALAFGLTVVAGVYAWGPISGGHFNPAVTLGLAAAGRFPWRETVGYLIAQVVGGALATSVIVLVGLFGPDGWLATAQDGGFASNGFGDHSPGGFGFGAAITVEIVLTAIFVLVILGVTTRRAARPPSRASRSALP